MNKKPTLMGELRRLENKSRTIATHPALFRTFMRVYLDYTDDDEDMIAHRNILTQLITHDAQRLPRDPAYQAYPEAAAKYLALYQEPYYLESTLTTTINQMILMINESIAIYKRYDT